MSKYNMVFRLDKISDENEFIATTIVGYDIKAGSIEQVNKLLKVAIKQARVLEADDTGIDLPSEDSTPAQSDLGAPSGAGEKGRL